MNLLFDFEVDKPNKTIYMTREFAADQDLVWDAFTKAEILDQWFAPQPWRAETKEMDFRVGGRWLYAMVSPENVRGWSLVEFLEIDAMDSFTGRNSFCDEHGQPPATGFVSSITKTSFQFVDGRTTVRISKQMPDLAVLEKFVALGYKDGSAMAMTNLDALLAKMASERGMDK